MVQSKGRKRASQKNIVGTAEFLAGRVKRKESTIRSIKQRASYLGISKDELLNKVIDVLAKSGNNQDINWLEKKEETFRRRSESRRKFWDEMSSEKREEISRKKSEAWKRMSPEEREEINRRRSEAGKKRWEGMSPEEREEINRRRSESWKKYWEKLSPEKKEEIGRKLSESQRKYWERMSPEEKEEFGKKISKTNKEKWKRSSPEEREEIRRKLSIGHISDKLKPVYSEAVDRLLRGAKPEVLASVLQNKYNLSEFEALRTVERASSLVVKLLEGR